MDKTMTPETRAFIKLVHSIEIELACAAAFQDDGTIASLEFLLKRAKRIWEGRNNNGA